MNVECRMLLLHNLKCQTRRQTMPITPKLLSCFSLVDFKFIFVFMSIASKADNKKPSSLVAAAAAAFGVLLVAEVERSTMTVSLSSVMVMMTVVAAALLAPLRSRRCGRCGVR